MPTHIQRDRLLPNLLESFRGILANAAAHWVTMTDGGHTLKQCPQCRLWFGKNDIVSPQMFCRQKMCSRACAEDAKKYTHEKMLAAFWAKIDKRGPDECWLWTGAKQRAGYGHFRNLEKKTITSSRYAWELANGPIPAGLHVLHRCDNRACCNPAHLFVGTHQENMIDMSMKERNSAPVLTHDQVRQARALLGKIRQKEIAAMFGVKQGVISKLKLGKTYAYVE